MSLTRSPSHASGASTAASAHARPWDEFPAEVADYLAANLPATVDEIVDAMRAEIPAYREALVGPLGDEVSRSVRAALDQFVALARYGEADLGPRRGFFAALGRAEARAGRSIDALLAAYRVGARLAWRRTREAARTAGLDAETMSLLAEATFAYVDELSAVSAQGYADEQSRHAGDLERRRAALAQVLTAAVAPPPARAEELAIAARWPLPATIAALVWSPSDDDRILSRLPHGTLAAAGDGLEGALVPDPDGPGRPAEIARAVREGTAVLGPTVAPIDAGRSLRRAADIHALASGGLLSGQGLIVAEEHLAEALLHASPELLEDLAERALAPLAAFTDNARRRHIETLRAWLDHHGDTPSVAESLHVHRQTVRYRLARLRELFGERLDDPDARFELLLALKGAT